MRREAKQVGIGIWSDCVGVSPDEVVLKALDCLFVASPLSDLILDLLSLSSFASSSKETFGLSLLFGIEIIKSVANFFFVSFRVEILLHLLFGAIDSSYDFSNRLLFISPFATAYAAFATATVASASTVLSVHGMGYFTRFASIPLVLGWSFYSISQSFFTAYTPSDLGSILDLLKSCLFLCRAGLGFSFLDSLNFLLGLLDMGRLLRLSHLGLLHLFGLGLDFGFLERHKSVHCF